MILKENPIVRFFKKNIKPYMQLDTFSNLVPSGSQPGMIYGLAKVHKENTPLRPVVSMIRIIMIIMVIFKCYFSGEHIALSINKNNNGVNIELGKTNRLKALCMLQLIHEINKLCVNKPRQNMKTKSICRNHWQKRSIMQTNSIR